MATGYCPEAGGRRQGRTMRLSITAVVCVTLLGCSAPKTPPELDVKAKYSAPALGLARIYVYRLGGVLLGEYGSFVTITTAVSARSTKGGTSSVTSRPVGGASQSRR
jgi:hypothetical protein